MQFPGITLTGDDVLTRNLFVNFNEFYLHLVSPYSNVGFCFVIKPVR